MKIKKKILFYKLKIFPNLFSSSDMEKYLKECGLSIGEGCRFYRPSSMNIDVSRPANLIIGNYCKITSNVTILAHDYSYSVVRRVYGTVMEKFMLTQIGDNVFLGMGSIILPGVTIGNNVIVGAGSVVNKNVPDNVVVAGNPAKVVSTLDEYYRKRNEVLQENARKQYRLLRRYFGRRPTIKEMGNFYPLYVERDIDKIDEAEIRIDLGGDNKEDVLNELLMSKGAFSNYEAFCEWAEE